MSRSHQNACICRDFEISRGEYELGGPVHAPFLAVDDLLLTATQVAVGRLIIPSLGTGVRIPLGSFTFENDTEHMGCSECPAPLWSCYRESDPVV